MQRKALILGSFFGFGGVIWGIQLLLPAIEATNPGFWDLAPGIALILGGLALFIASYLMRRP